MEATIAVLKPKNASSLSGKFRPGGYDILLINTERQSSNLSISDEELLNNANAKKFKQLLPCTNILLDDEPANALLAFLNKFTSGDGFGGLKGKRAVFVPASKSDPIGDRGTLYCIPVEHGAKVSTAHVSGLKYAVEFCSLDVALQTHYSNHNSFANKTRTILQRLHSWLTEKHQVPGAIDVLFSSPAEARWKATTTNPAYVDTSHNKNSFTLNDTVTQSQSNANEVLAKMLAIDKCDITKINPLFGSDLKYKYKPDRVVVNKYWGLGKPDYSKVVAQPEKLPKRSFESDTIIGRERLAFLPDTVKDRHPPHWRDDYPLHRHAMIGNAEGILRLLGEGYLVTQRDKDSNTPIHLAASYGHVKAITVLLNEGKGSPNITDDQGRTPLHVAAMNNRSYIIELLLSDQDIDVNALDKSGKTALDYCEPSEEWKASANLLRFAMNHPTPTIQVYLMDGSCRLLNLTSKANTTVQQLHLQMMRIINLPENCSHLFTIWICSRNLQLQLKPEHKPIQHLNDWKRRIVLMLTDQDPSKEDPQLFWRRDAILSMEEERNVRNPVAINLLFLEAYHNYIKSLYPCAETDATILAGILMQMHHGSFNRNNPPRINDPKLLQTLIPAHMLQQNRNVNWVKNILDQYNGYSKNMADRDHALPVLQVHFLMICWNLTAYGSAFFTGYAPIRSRQLTPVYIGVNDVGLHIIIVETKTMWKSFTYTDIDVQLKRNTQWPSLEVRSTTSNRTTTYILQTKQAGLIHHLMAKLAQLNSHS